MEGKKDKESLMGQKKKKKSQNPTAADASLSVVTEATPSEPIWILQPYSQSPNAAAGSFPVALLGKKADVSGTQDFTCLPQQAAAPVL